MFVLFPPRLARREHSGKEYQLSKTRPLLLHLYRTHRANPQAEVSGQELEHELGLTPEAVRAAVAELVSEGLVESDPLLTNLWMRLTEKGLAFCEENFGGEA